MENERMAILKMIADGAITPEEGSNLLQAISEPSVQSHKNTQQSNIQPNENRQQERPIMQKIETDAVSKRFENFASDLSRKVETLAKDMEPKLQKFTEVVVEGTVTVADKISKSLTTPTHTPKYSQSTQTYSSPPPTPISASGEKTFELKINSKDCELNINGLHGNVLLKGYNGDKISGKIYCQAKKNSASIEFMALGNKYSLNYNEDDFHSVSIDAYVPEYLFKHINVQTVNGTLSLATLNTEFLTVNNMNGNTDIQNTDCKNLSYESSNGSLSLINVHGENAKIENFNGSSQITNFDVCHLQMEAFNGAILMTTPNLTKFSN